METVKDISKSTLSTMVLPHTCIGTWTDIMKLADGSPGSLGLNPYTSNKNFDDNNSRSGWEMEDEGTAANMPMSQNFNSI